MTWSLACGFGAAHRTPRLIFANYHRYLRCLTCLIPLLTCHGRHSNHELLREVSLIAVYELLSLSERSFLIPSSPLTMVITLLGDMTACGLDILAQGASSPPSLVSAVTQNAGTKWFSPAFPLRLVISFCTYHTRRGEFQWKR